MDDWYKFSGKELEKSYGVYYFGARWLNPALGEFLSMDPPGLFGGSEQHRYVYVDGAVYDRIDPDGNLSWKKLKRNVLKYGPVVLAPGLVLLGSLSGCNKLPDVPGGGSPSGIPAGQPSGIPTGQTPSIPKTPREALRKMRDSLNSSPSGVPNTNKIPVGGGTDKKIPTSTEDVAEKVSEAATRKLFGKVRWESKRQARRIAKQKKTMKALIYIGVALAVFVGSVVSSDGGKEKGRQKGGERAKESDSGSKAVEQAEGVENAEQQKKRTVRRRYDDGTRGPEQDAVHTKRGKSSQNVKNRTRRVRTANDADDFDD